MVTDSGRIYCGDAVLLSRPCRRVRAPLGRKAPALREPAAVAQCLPRTTCWPMKKSVIIVEDNCLMRALLLRILASASDLTCLGAFDSGEEALPIIAKTRPDVVLMDIKLPGMTGIQCVVEIKKVMPKTQILMMTVFEDSEYIFAALQAGASGYLLKSSLPQQIINAVRDVYDGGSPMSSNIARRVIEYFNAMGLPVRANYNLSPRQVEILELLGGGFTYREIERQFHIGAETVRSHVKNICKKMHARSRLEAVARYERSDSHPALRPQKAL